MSLSTQTNRTDHTENGVTTVFPFDFKIFSEADLVVISVDQNTLTETTLSLGTDYTISGVNADAGSVTLVTGPGTSGDRLIIKRVMNLVQPTRLRNQGDFFPATHERAFDRSIMIDQQQQEEIDRSFKLSPSATAGSVEAPSAEPGYALGWDALGNLTNVPNTGADQTLAWTAADAVVAADAAVATALVRSDLASTATGEGAEMVGYLAPYTGAVARLQSSKNAEYISVKDFGAVGNGIADDTVAIQAAFATLLAGTTNGSAATGNGRIYFPKGTYKISSTISPVNSASNYMIFGDGPRASMVVWAGSAGLPMIKCVNPRQVVFEGLGVIGNTSTPPSACIQVHRDGAWTGPGAPTEVRFARCNFGGDGGGMATTGVLYSAESITYDSNNDRGYFEQCNFDNLIQDGLWFAHGNSLVHAFVNCGFSNCARSAINTVHSIGTFDASFIAFGGASSGCGSTWRLGGTTHAITICGWQSEGDYNILDMPATASPYPLNLTLSGVSWIGAAPLSSSGAWVTSTAYVLGDTVSNGGNNYFCLVGHTSGTFATDLAAGKWVLGLPSVLKYDAGSASTLSIQGGRITSSFGIFLNCPTTASNVRVDGAYFNYAGIAFNNNLLFTSVLFSTGNPAFRNIGSGWFRCPEETIFIGGSGYQPTLNTSVAETTILAGGGSLGNSINRAIPANSFHNGTAYRIKMNGYISDTGTPTLQIRVKGSATVWDTGAITLPTLTGNQHWEAEWIIFGKTEGASGTVKCSGHFRINNTNALFVMAPAPTGGDTTINTTAAFTIDVTAQWGTSNVSNNIVTQNCTIEKIQGGRF